MFACSYCTSVASPSWWHFEVLPRWHLPVVAAPLVLVGLVLAYWALTRLTGRRRIGALLVAVSLGVGFPAAALTVNSAARYIEVASIQKPFDNPTWNVRCDSAFQTRPMDNDVSRDTTTACTRATQPWRWGAGTILLTSMALLVGGVVTVAQSDGIASPDQPVKPDSPVAA